MANEPKTIRERFIQVTDHFNINTWTEQEQMINYMMENNVVAFPIDIGTVLFYINGGYYNTKNKKAVAVTVTEINKKITHGKVNWGFVCSNGARYTFDSFGKTIFFTKKDCDEKIVEILSKKQYTH